MEGYDIPIGYDISALQEGFDAVIQAIEKVGAQITAALGKANIAIASTENGMRMAGASTNALAAAQSQLGASVGASAAKLNQSISTAANLGTAMTGLQSGVMLTAKASRALTGVNLATALSGWISRAGGIKAAFATIPAAMARIAANPLFRKIAIGAAVAIGGILAIRTAWRTVSGAARLAANVAQKVFTGIRSAATAAARGMKGAFSSIMGMPGKIFGSIPGIGSLLAAGGAAALLVTQLKGASDSASTFEDLTVSVEHFTGSAAKAKTLLDDLAGFALKTPFDTLDVQQTAGGLLGAGITEDVAGITKDIAAMARNGQELGELGDALGKGFAKGKFQTEEVNKFLERGINLNPALQAQLGLSGEAFQKAVQAGLSFEDVTAAIRSMSREGGQFFGLLPRRAETFGGKISTLSSAWTDLRKEFGKPFNDALKPILQSTIDALTSLMDKARSFGKSVGRAITIGFVAFKDGRMGELFTKGLSLGTALAVDTLMRGLRGAIAFLATTLPPLFASLGAKLTDPVFWEGLGYLFQGFGKLVAAEIRAALPGADKEEYAHNVRMGKTLMTSGGGMINASGNGDNLAETLKTAITAGAVAAKEAALEGGASESLKAAQESWKTLMGELGKKAEAIEKATAAATEMKTGKREGGGIITENMGPNETVADTVNKSVAPAVLSLARIGGGGFASSVMNSVLTEAKIQTRHLKQLVENTKGGAKNSVYAS